MILTDLKTSAQFSKGMCDGLPERPRTAGEVTFSAEEWDITEGLKTAPKAMVHWSNSAL